MTGIRERKDTYKHRSLKQRRRDKWMHKHRQALEAGIGIAITLAFVFIVLWVVNL